MSLRYIYGRSNSIKVLELATRFHPMSVIGRCGSAVSRYTYGRSNFILSVGASDEEWMKLRGLLFVHKASSYPVWSISAEGGINRLLAAWEPSVDAQWLVCTHGSPYAPFRVLLLGMGIVHVLKRAHHSSSTHTVYAPAHTHTTHACMHIHVQTIHRVILTQTHIRMNTQVDLGLSDPELDDGGIWGDTCFCPPPNLWAKFMRPLVKLQPARLGPLQMLIEINLEVLII